MNIKIRQPENRQELFVHCQKGSTTDPYESIAKFLFSIHPVSEPCFLLLIRQIDLCCAKKFSALKVSCKSLHRVDFPILSNKTMTTFANAPLTNWADIRIRYLCCVCRNAIDNASEGVDTESSTSQGTESGKILIFLEKKLRSSGCSRIRFSVEDEAAQRKRRQASKAAAAAAGRFWSEQQQQTLSLSLPAAAATVSEYSSYLCSSSARRL